VAAGAGGQTANNSVDVKVATKEVVVVAWVNGNVISLPQGASPGLVTNLDSPLLCPVQLGAWASRIRLNINTDIDRQFANAFLIKNSANSLPPNTIDPDAVETGGDFRLFNRLQVFFQEENGQIVGVPEFLRREAKVGATPDPCGVIPFRFGGEPHPSNGENRVTSSGTGLFQLNEGRIGLVGRAVDRTLNDPTGTVGATTPWIWSVVKFDSAGNPAPLDHQIFPTYFVYENGQKVGEFSQSDPESFISLDSGSQRTLEKIQ